MPLAVAYLATGEWSFGNNKTRFFNVLYSDKTWIFVQSEGAQGPIYIINIGELIFAELLTECLIVN